MKNKRGITLIALIITIIVLLILAGVVINMTVGNNGIIEKSQVATEKYKEQQVKEQLELLMTEAKLQAIDEKQAFTAEYLKTYLETKLGNKVQAQIDEEGMLQVTIDGYTFPVNVEKISNQDTPSITEQTTNIAGTNIEKAYEYGIDDVKLKNFITNANTNTKVKHNGIEITSVKELPVGEYYLKYNSATNEIEVQNDIYINDLSGNGKNLYLKNETQIQKDSNGKYYLNFDGVDDYAQINELESTINWADGFTVEFEAEWNAFNSWSRIMDFGNGWTRDNLVIANENMAGNLYLQIYNGSNYSCGEGSASAIVKDVKAKYTIKHEKNDNGTYNILFLKNDEQISSYITTAALSNLTRTSNYIGKSNNLADGYFKGKIYSLKITDAQENEIVNYNIDTTMNTYNYAKINIVGNEYVNTIEDLTGNRHKMYLKEGAKISKDSNNKYYLNFDGEDDYAQISGLGSEINWTDGFTVEFEAEWNAFNSWSRIMDFGNGWTRDNLVIANENMAGNLYLQIYNGFNYSCGEGSASAIVKDVKAKYTIKHEKNDNGTYNILFLKNDEQISSYITTAALSNLTRTLNYIGKSNNSADGYFKGKIYSLKITQADGTPILWYDINKWLEMSK